MKILITGVAGFIAHKVAELVLQDGREVVGIDNMNSYYDVSLKTYRLDRLLQYNNFTFIQADIEDAPSLDNIFKKYGFTTVFNLAARAGVRYSLINPWVYFRTNVEGTLNILECMKTYGVKKLVFASTSSLYSGSSMPFIETMTVDKPISPYAASKKAAEVLAYTYYLQYGIDISILRYFTVFGPYGRPDMAPYRFIKLIHERKPITIYGDGSQLRDFTYIDDIAKGTVISEKSLGYEIINLGAGNSPISINAFIGLIEKISGLKAEMIYLPAHTADLDFTMADISKAASLLNWNSEIGVEEGLRRTMEDINAFRFSL